MILDQIHNFGVFLYEYVCIHILSYSFFIPYEELYSRTSYSRRKDNVQNILYTS